MGLSGHRPLCAHLPLRLAAAIAAFDSAAHAAGISVILDWWWGHFPTDEHGLAQFDGTPLYEHADPREGYHQDWNTLIYNFGRTEVKKFPARQCALLDRALRLLTACVWMPWPR